MNLDIEGLMDAIFQARDLEKLQQELRTALIEKGLHNSKRLYGDPQNTFQVES